MAVTALSRFRHWALMLGLVVLFPLFFVGGPDWSSGPLFKSAWNLGHILFFAMLVCVARPHRWFSGLSLWLVVTVVVTGFGGFIELAQDGLSRQSDWHDLLRDLIGAWLALAWFQPAARSCGGRYGRMGTRGITLALAIMEMSLVLGVAYQQVQVHRLLPALYDFNSDTPSAYWSGSATIETSSMPTGDPALKIGFGSERHSGAFLDNLPGDWRHYDRLLLTLDNTSAKPIALVLRINDRRHEDGDSAFEDRFNQRLLLQPGSNRFTIDLAAVRTAPANRTMDMDDIRRLGLFAALNPGPTVIYLQDLHLELP